MKRIAFLGALLISTTLMAAGQIQEDLHQEDGVIVKSLELEFNDVAKADDIFLSWKLVGDWDKFDYQFSQGTLEKDVYTIKASEYQAVVDGKKGITLTITTDPKSKIKEGLYDLSMKLHNVSNEVELPDGGLDLDLKVNYIPTPPIPLWKRLLIPGIILLALIALLLLVLHLASIFPRGLLQLGREEVSLKGKTRISVKEELEKMEITLEEGTDVIFVKKRFGRFQGPCIKLMSNCSLERDGLFVSKGTVLLPEEELRGLTDIHGDEVLIRYC